MNINLNFDKGKSLGYIIGGEYDGEILYVSMKEEKSISKTKKKISMDDEDILIEQLYKEMKGKVPLKRMEQLRDSIKDKQRPNNRELANYYDYSVKHIAKNKNKEIVLKEGDLNPMFDMSVERQVFMITGMSGSGKSTYTSHLVKSYHKQYPKNRIILFSNKDSDPVFDKLKYLKRVIIDEDLIEDPITLHELKKTLVIFDDIEGNPSKKINIELDRLRDLILQQGRSYKCSFVYISHLANNYKQTRTILNEANAITVFPAMTTRYALKYLLEKYFGFDKRDIDKLVRLPSRWITIYKAPTMVLYAKGCYLLNNF